MSSIWAEKEECWIPYEQKKIVKTRSKEVWKKLNLLYKKYFWTVCLFQLSLLHIIPSNWIEVRKVNYGKHYFLCKYSKKKWKSDQFSLSFISEHCSTWIFVHFAVDHQEEICESYCSFEDLKQVGTHCLNKAQLLYETI